MFSCLSDSIFAYFDNCLCNCYLFISVCLFLCLSDAMFVCSSYVSFKLLPFSLCHLFVFVWLNLFMFLPLSTFHLFLYNFLFLCLSDIQSMSFSSPFFLFICVYIRSVFVFTSVHTTVLKSCWCSFIPCFFISFFKSYATLIQSYSNNLHCYCWNCRMGEFQELYSCFLSKTLFAICHL